MKNKRLNKLDKNTIVIGLVCLLAGAALGFVSAKQLYQEKQFVRVWAADETITVPKDLKKYLESSEDDCKEYAGTGSPKGMSLNAVEKVVGDNYAKIAYGCGSDLSGQTVVIKQGSSWTTLQPMNFYRDVPNQSDPAGLRLPACSELKKYNISKEAEPECLDTKDQIKNNPNQ